MLKPKRANQVRLWFSSFIIFLATNVRADTIVPPSASPPTALTYDVRSAKELEAEGVPNLDCQGQVDPGDPRTIYRVAKYDLNEDGIPELIISYPAFASAGFYYSITQKTSYGVKELYWFQAKQFSFIPRHKNFADIEVWVKASSDCMEKQLILFDGKKYANKAIHPSLFCDGKPQKRSHL